MTIRVAGAVNRRALTEPWYDYTLPGAGNFDVQGIPPMGSVIEFFLLARSDVAGIDGDTIFLQINGDATSANYRYQQIQANGTSLLGSQADQQNMGGVTGATATANYFGITHGYIFNYADTAIFKQVEISSLHRRGATSHFTRYLLLHWESTAAITRLTFLTDNDPTDQFIVGSRLWLRIFP